MESTNVSLPQRLIGIAIAVVLVAGACFIPGSEALGREGIITLGALLALAALWATSALPIGIIALLIPVTLIVLGAANAGAVFAGYAAPPLFFIIAVFALPVIMQKTQWGLRLINVLLKWTGSDSRKLVLGFMIATTLVSTVMSDVPTTVLFLGFALTILKAAGAKPGSSNLGKCLMIAVPVASVTGGIATRRQLLQRRRHGHHAADGRSWHQLLRLDDRRCAAGHRHDSHPVVLPDHHHQARAHL